MIHPQSYPQVLWVNGNTLFNWQLSKILLKQFLRNVSRIFKLSSCAADELCHFFYLAWGASMQPGASSSTSSASPAAHLSASYRPTWTIGQPDRLRAKNRADQ